MPENCYCLYTILTLLIYVRALLPNPFLDDTVSHEHEVAC